MFKYFVLIIIYLSSYFNFQNHEKSFGKVFGQVILSPKPKNLKTSLEQIPISIKPLGIKINPDSNGVFSVDKIPRGKYSFEVKYLNYRSIILENVDVQKDSISLLFFKLIGSDKSMTPDRKLWRESKIKNVNTNSPGRICGFVKDADHPMLFLKFGYVVVENTFWGTTPDSNGIFRIDYVLPGEYILKASAFGYHQSIYKKVRVLENKVSIVNFQLIPNAIPEEPFPLEWKASYEPMLKNN